MSATMRVSAIFLKNYRQFRRIKIDLTHPETKQPLDKICFIGPNASGKSTLLGLLNTFLSRANPAPHTGGWGDQDTIIGFKVRFEKDDYIVISIKLSNVQRPTFYALPAQVEHTKEWAEIWDTPGQLANNTKLISFLTNISDNEIVDRIRLKPDSNDLVIYAPPDGSSLLKSTLPGTNLSNALSLFDNLPAHHIASFDQIKHFWNFLIYQIKKRERDFQQFLESPETQSMSVAEARKKFEAENPEILKQLAEQWNFILEQANLEFDTENAQTPVQLNENLQAYIKLKRSTGPKANLPYNILSTGIRNFIFKFGHVYTLYFNREIERGFLLLDEPEASLHPDLLYDLIERYLSIIHNTQFFVATQNPIIALQFQPFERIALAFDDHGYVTWRRGVSAEGDDPNDLLMNDFLVRSIYGKKGVEQWKRFIELRRQILETNDVAEKKKLLDEYTQIGNAYNFAPDEIS